MSEMVERVARAIEPLLFASENPTHRAAAIDKAIYAIAAMRKPTEAMVKAGHFVPVERGAYYEGESTDAAACWQAMIDAALKD